MRENDFMPFPGDLARGWPRRRFAALLVASLALLVAACGGLGGEPEIIATIPPPTVPPPSPEIPAVIEINYPETQPNLARGREIFAANCTDCHGISGAGDGQLALDGQVSNPGDFTDPATSAGQTPLDYFEIITEGNLAALMPPWRDALSDEERWAVALYTYTLHYTEEQLAAGRELYLRECAECHGEAGRGDGPEAPESLREINPLDDPAAMTTLGDHNLYVIITEGAGDDMPAYEDSLTEEERRAVVAYTRTLSLDTADVPAAPLVEEEPEEPTAVAAAPAATTGRITGQIVNGTADGEIPAELTVQLHILNADFEEQTIATTTGPQGEYRFEDVTIREDHVYFVSTRHHERSFASPPAAGQPDGEMELPVVIYELTDDPSVIGMIGMVTQINVVGDLMEVLHVARFENYSDRLFTTGRELPGGRFASVDLALPPGAVILGLEGEQRFVVDEENFTITDTRALLPGAEHFVRVSYLLPYREEAIIEYPVDYSLNGPVHVLIDTDRVQLAGEQFQPLGVETIHNRQYQAYGGSLSLDPGEVVRFTLRGPAVAGTGTSQDPSVITADNLLPVIGLLALIVAFVIGGVFFISRRGTADPAVQRSVLIDGLVKQIAELDAQHDTGQINHDIYQRRRAALKARLTELMDSGSDQ
jgi:mono/diheme cytochrome c family protein